MAPGLDTWQQLATVALNAAVALVVGAVVSRLWLMRGASGWAQRAGRPLRFCAIGGVLAALFAHGALLWLQAAMVAELPVEQAGAAAVSLLGASHFGLAWRSGAIALAIALAVLGYAGYAPLRQPWRRALPPFVVLAALAVFAYTRSMVSHAASEGDASAAMLADWTHFSLASLWLGAVLVAGLLVLRYAPGIDTAGRRDRARYVAALSGSATLALAGIVLAGLFSAWHNLGSVGQAAGHPYANLLLLKLAFVVAAAVLGGVNRWLVMPALLDATAGPAPSDAAAARFVLILRVEAAVLLAVLALAALLASTSPPVAS